MSFGGSQLCDGVWAPKRLSLSTAIITAILALVTVPGNLLICLAVLKDPYNNLRSSFNFIVLNLAISDLITGLITEPVFVWFHASEANGDPVLGNMWIVHVTYFISCMASLQSIAALALERYLTATSKYRRRFPAKKALYISIFIWISSIGLSMIYFATTFYKYVVIFSTVATSTTLGIIIFSYVRIYQSLHSHVESNADNSSRDRAKAKIVKYEKKTTRAFLYILVVFMMFNIPSCTMAYVINFCVTCECDVIHWLRDFQFLLALLNCSSNQFLYALRMPQFLRAIGSLLRVCPFIPRCLNGVDVVRGALDTNTKDLDKREADTTKPKSESYRIGHIDTASKCTTI
ncbi:hypothetical protein QZH41_005766 [Actinostola sp. cb2023]|nr:hypothetical protein QZH41_005766 [Actinostola sp. cb2023]